MTLREWIPIWLTTYKLGTIKERSFHQLELLARHIHSCVVDDIRNGKDEVVDELVAAVQKLMK